MTCSAAIRAIQIFGRFALLTKIDVKAAFKRVPVRPEDRHLRGMKWRGKILLRAGAALRSAHQWLSLGALRRRSALFVRAPLWRQTRHPLVDDFLLVASPNQLESVQLQLKGVSLLCKRLGVPPADHRPPARAPASCSSASSWIQTPCSCV